MSALRLNLWLTSRRPERKLPTCRRSRKRRSSTRLQQRLVQKYAHLAAGDVSAAVEAALTRFERSSIRDFVPLLVERGATAQLSKNRLPAAVGESQPAIT